MQISHHSLQLICRHLFGPRDIWFIACNLIVFIAIAPCGQASKAIHEVKESRIFDTFEAFEIAFASFPPAAQHRLLIPVMWLCAMKMVNN